MLDSCHGEQIGSEAMKGTARFAEVLLETGLAQSERVALSGQGASGAGGQLCYGELHERIERVAAGIVARGARVVLLSSPNSLALVTSLLGALQARARVLLLPADLPAAALAAAARTSGASLAVACAGDERFAALALPIVDEAELATSAPSARELLPGSGALLLPTSGTTGASKIVVRSQPGLETLARTSARAFGIAPDDRCALALPICHSYGLDQLLAALAAGARVDLHQGFQLGALRRAFREDGVSFFPGVPLMLDALSRGDRFEAPELRRVLSSGSPLARRVYERFLAVSGIAIGQFYGATEFGPVAYNDPAAPSFDPLEVGVAIGDAAIRVLARAADDPARELPPGREGLLAVSGPTLMDGYLAHPSPLRGGFFVTGDLGVRSERGVVRVTGRSAFVIDVGGKKVNPAEVERVLALHPGVREVVVLPAASTDTTARLRAVVIPEPGACPDEVELRRFARGQLPPHMIPRRIELCPDPPRGATGKILRAQLLAERTTR